MWRYKLVPMEPLARDESRLKMWEEKLNELGVEGWEVVTIIGHGDRWCTGRPA